MDRTKFLEGILAQIRLHGKKAEQRLTALDGPDQMELINLIQNCPDITQSELIGLTGMEQPRISQVLAGLKRHGYISSWKAKKQVHYNLNFMAFERVASAARRLAVYHEH